MGGAIPSSGATRGSSGSTWGSASTGSQWGHRGGSSPWQRQQSPASTGGASEICGFGKYRGMHFADVLEKDRQYCEWIVSSASEDSGPALRAMALYLQDRGVTGRSKAAGAG